MAEIRATLEYDRVFRLLPAALGEPIPRPRREDRGAQRDFAALLALPRDERARKIQRAQERFRSAALVRLLIAESRRRLPADPGEACHFAELARTITHRNPRMPGSFGLVALSTAEMANACRAGGEARKAEDHFSHARYVIAQYGVTDSEILARVDSLEGALRMDQRRLEEAERLLARAVMLYRAGGERVEAARALVTMGGLFFVQGDLTAAIETTTAALRGWERADEPRLHLCARYNLARYLTADGQAAMAAELLAADEELYREFPEAWTQLRLLWLRGKIALGQGDAAGAERAFLAARDGFLREGDGHAAAMVWIEDLALLYVRAGRTADVKRIAEEIHPLFAGRDIHREAVTALALFQEAARRETLTVQAVLDVVRSLQAARTDPTPRCEQFE